MTDKCGRYRKAFPISNPFGPLRTREGDFDGEQGGYKIPKTLGILLTLGDTAVSKSHIVDDY